MTKKSIEKINDLVSIIMPTYNSEKYIHESIQSVVNQTYKNWELIIVDNNSKDETVKKIKEFSKFDKRIKLFINDENKGIAYSRNRAILLSEGSFTSFLDSDDSWEKNKLRFQLDFMKKNNYKFSFTDYNVINASSKIISKSRKTEEIIDYNKQLKANYIGTLTVMIDTNIIKDFLMPRIKYEDYATWLLILKSGYKAYKLKLELSNYRKHNSFSKNKIKSLTWTYGVYRYVTQKNILIVFLLTLRFALMTFLNKIVK